MLYLFLQFNKEIKFLNIGWKKHKIKVKIAAQTFSASVIDSFFLSNVKYILHKNNKRKNENII